MDFFSIKQNYYTGDFVHALQDIEKHSESKDDTLLFYKLKTLLALKKYEAGSSQTNPIGATFDLYVKYLKSRDISALESHVNTETASPYELYLLASALAIEGRYDESLEVCVYGIDNSESTGTTELLLLAIQVTLLNGQFSIAQTLFDNFIGAQEDNITSEDELIINLAESYIKFATNQDTTSSNFYYFEELAQTFPTWKTQLGLLNLHLQQSNIEEAQGIVNVLESEYYSVEQKEAAELYKPHFLANKITLSILSGSNDVDELKKELEQLDPNHVLIQNNRMINANFDEIVAKYNV